MRSVVYALQDDENNVNVLALQTLQPIQMCSMPRATFVRLGERGDVGVGGNVFRLRVAIADAAVGVEAGTLGWQGS